MDFLVNNAFLILYLLLFSFVILLEPEGPAWRKRKTFLLDSENHRPVRNIYESRFNGTFLVLMYPLRNLSEENNLMKSLLRKMDITVLDYPVEVGGEYIIAGNYHPNAKLNLLLAQLIAHDLNRMEVTQKRDL